MIFHAFRSVFHLFPGVVWVLGSGQVPGGRDARQRPARATLGEDLKAHVRPQRARHAGAERREAYLGGGEDEISTTSALSRRYS